MNETDELRRMTRNELCWLLEEGGYLRSAVINVNKAELIRLIEEDVPPQLPKKKRGQT